MEDVDKAYHCLRYLNGSKEYGLRLNALDPVTVIQYIDAAHGVHQNMKSHAGSVTTLGRGTIAAASSAIDMNAKSACESEGRKQENDENQRSLRGEIGSKR